MIFLWMINSNYIFKIYQVQNIKIKIPFNMINCYKKDQNNYINQNLNYLDPIKEYKIII